jgi:hypothetical protein
MSITRLLKPAPEDPHGGDFTVGDMAPRFGSGSGSSGVLPHGLPELAARERAAREQLQQL